jgi:hypothetical protein
MADGQNIQKPSEPPAQERSALDASSTILVILTGCHYFETVVGLTIFKGYLLFKEPMHVRQNLS